jgi:AcrR family transcriptional regulator
MADTRRQLLDAARASLLEVGYANLSTRRIAESAGLALGHLHYHFGSKRNLILAVLADDNERLLERQRTMYEGDAPLWKQWEQACDYLDDDLRSGYVRVLQEMTAAGWSEPEIATSVRAFLGQWFDLLTAIAERTERGLGSLGPFTAAEVAALAGDAFLGAESMLLLGVSEDEVPHRGALRKVGEWIRTMEEAEQRSGG